MGFVGLREYQAKQIAAKRSKLEIKQLNPSVLEHGSLPSMVQNVPLMGEAHVQQ